ncbi:MAG: ferredoxin [Patescibacteria group bacterium]
MAEEKKSGGAGSRPAGKIKKIVVNRDLCIGAASCVVNAPGVFELDGENKAVIMQKGGAKNSGPTERPNFEDGTIDDEALLMAAQSCPTKAIFVYDEDDRQVYP